MRCRGEFYNTVISVRDKIYLNFVIYVRELNVNFVELISVLVISFPDLFLLISYGIWFLDYLVDVFAITEKKNIKKKQNSFITT